MNKSEIIQEREDKEIQELKAIHDSLEEGLPDIPPQLVQFARDRLKLEEMRETPLADPEKNEARIMKQQSIDVENIASLM
jgi:hypothetical protein